MDTPAMIIIIASMRKIIPKTLFRRCTPSIRMAVMEQRRQGTPTAKAKALGNAAVNSSDNQMMIAEKSTMAHNRCRKETKLPNVNMAFLMVHAIAALKSVSTRMSKISLHSFHITTYILS